MKTIEITIDETGETTVDLKGFQGKGCEKVMEAFTSGNVITRLDSKPEIRMQDTEKERVKS